MTPRPAARTLLWPQDEAVAQLRDQPAFRSEYFALWEQQRKVPISAAGEQGQVGGTEGLGGASR